MNNKRMINCMLMSVKKYYFTLTELLVVIAIISMLASILMPTLQRSLSTARDIRCKSNLRQIGLTCNNYMNDNKAMVVNGSHANTENKSWGWLLGERGYIEYTGSSGWESVGVFNCPSVSSDDIYSHYGIATSSSSDKANPLYWVTRLKNPSHKVLVAEVIPILTSYWSISAQFWSFSAIVSEAYPQRKALRHQKYSTCNILYGDMHVRFVNSYHGMSIYDPESFFPELSGSPRWVGNQ